MVPKWLVGLCLVLCSVKAFHIDDSDIFGHRHKGMARAVPQVGKPLEVQLGYAQFHRNPEDLEGDQEKGTSHYYEVRKYPDHTFQYFIQPKTPENPSPPQKAPKSKRVPAKPLEDETKSAKTLEKINPQKDFFMDHMKLNEEIFKLKKIKESLEANLRQQKANNANLEKIKDVNVNKNKNTFEKEHGPRLVFRPEKPSPFKPSPLGHQAEKHRGNSGAVRKSKHQIELELIHKYGNHNYDQEELKNKVNLFMSGNQEDKYRQGAPQAVSYVKPAYHNKHKIEDVKENSEPLRIPENTRDEVFENINQNDENVEEIVRYVRPYPVYEPQPYPGYENEEEQEDSENRFRFVNSDQVTKVIYRPSLEELKVLSDPDRRVPFTLDGQIPFTSLRHSEYEKFIGLKEEELAKLGVRQSHQEAKNTHSDLKSRPHHQQGYTNEEEEEDDEENRERVPYRKDIIKNFRPNVHKSARSPTGAQRYHSVHSEPELEGVQQPYSRKVPFISNTSRHVQHQREEDTDVEHEKNINVRHYFRSLS